MQDLLPVVPEPFTDELHEHRENEASSRRLSIETISVEKGPIANNLPAKTIDLVQQGILPEMRIKNDDPSTTPESRALADVTADNPNASDHLKELKALELLMQRGKTVEPEELLTALQNATIAWKLAPDEAVDGSAERREYFKTLDNIFKRFDFETSFSFLNQLSHITQDSSYMGRALELLFATTAFEVGFDHRSLKSAGPQDSKFGKSIVAIWSGLPEARQRRILAAMAAKYS